MDLMQTIAAIPGIGPALPYLTLAALANALIVAPALAPPASPASRYGFFYRVSNACAGNFGRARNANAPAVPSPLSPPRALSLLWVIGLAVTLSACGTLSPAPTGTPLAAVQSGAAAGSPLAALQSGAAAAQTGVQGVVTAAVSDVQTDLTAAIAKAKAATPPDTEFSNCGTYLQTSGSGLLAQLGGATAPLCSAPVCGITGFESARLGLTGVGNALSPLSKTAFENACGPLVMSVQNQAATAATEAAGLLALFGIKIAVPALAAVP